MSEWQVNKWGKWAVNAKSFNKCSVSEESKCLSRCITVGIKYIVHLKHPKWCLAVVLRFLLALFCVVAMVIISCRCSCSFLTGSGPLGPALIGCFSGDPAELHPDNWVHSSIQALSSIPQRQGLVPSGGNTFLMSCTASGSWLQSTSSGYSVMNTLSGTYQSMVTFLSETGVGTPESHAYNSTALPSSQNWLDKGGCLIWWASQILSPVNLGLWPSDFCG